MAHTYLKYKDNQYGVGQWLITSMASGAASTSNVGTTQQFVPLFFVPSLKQAITAVNMLNGGTRVAVDALHLREKE